MAARVHLDELTDGVITSIEDADASGERVRLTVDGTYRFEVSSEILREHALAVNDELSAARQRKMLIADEMGDAREVALNYVSYKPRTKAEVRRRLGRGDFRSIVIEDVVYELSRQGHLDDAAYARMFAEERFSSKGYGPFRVRQDLRKRGVPEEMIEQAIDEVFDAGSVRSEALRLAEKRWPRLAYEDDARKRAKKLFDFLARRGYPFDVAREVVDQVTGGH